MPKKTSPKKWSRREPSEVKEHRSAWARLYQEGASIRDIAKEYGRSYGTVHRVLNEAQVPMRARGGKHRKSE